ncbi:MAG: hypothetical protein ACRDQ5_12675 [Sciscionella sp.]
MANENDSARADGVPSGLSRRRLLTASAGLGAAGLAAGMFVNTSSSATAVAAGATHAQSAPAGEVDEPVVAHVRDARTGELDLFVGERHIRLRDPQLAAGLLRAAH